MVIECETNDFPAIQSPPPNNFKQYIYKTLRIVTSNLCNIYPVTHLRRRPIGCLSWTRGASRYNEVALYTKLRSYLPLQLCYLPIFTLFSKHQLNATSVFHLIQTSLLVTLLDTVTIMRHWHDVLWALFPPWFNPVNIILTGTDWPATLDSCCHAQINSNGDVMTWKQWTHEWFLVLGIYRSPPVTDGFHHKGHTMIISLSLSWTTFEQQIALNNESHFCWLETPLWHRCNVYWFVHKT